MILLICGVGRAGKSTYSSAFEDVIHFDLMGRIVERYRKINEIVSHKDNAVIEGIYNRKEYRIELLKAYKGNNKICIWLNTPKSVVLERMVKDSIPVTQEHFYFEPPTYAEGWDEIVIMRDNDPKRVEVIKRGE